MEGLSAICAGLGVIEEDDNGNRNSYTPGEYCLDNLKDLLRFLRRDDPQTREVFKQVCKWNIVGKDLIPIIEHCQDDRNLVLNSVKVLVFLTMPVEPTSNDIPQQIEYLWGLMSSITCSDIVPVIVSLLESPLENLEHHMINFVLSSEAFTEDDWKLVQLVLTLFRNILAIQDIPLHEKAGGSATQFLSLRDKFLELLFRENATDLILVLTQHIGGSCGYIRQDNLLLLETFHYIFIGQEPELIAKAYSKGLKDGSKTLCKGNPCSASHDPLHNSHKVHRGPLKRVVWDYGRLPSTRDNTLELLHDFVNQLLSGGYNGILSSNMKADPFEASVNHHADSTLFEGNLCGPIAASMNESMFLLVISKWRYAYDSLKQTNEYKFVSAAGSLMKIMIRMLDLVLKVSPEDSKDPQTARILLYKLFYDQTDQGMTQFLLNQMKSFDTHKQAKSDLADLVETIHVVIRLIENLEARGTLRVSRKSRKKRAKKIMNDKSKIDQPVGDHVPLQNEVSNPGCEQSAHSSMLSEEKLMNPSSDVNGEETAEPFQVDKPETSELDTLNHESNLPGMKNTKSDVNCDGIDDSSSDEQLPVTNEVDFEASALVSALASNALIQNLCWLLKFYKTNSTSTNHYIICMLRRICDDLELSPMLYQLSLLNTFYIILAEQKSSPCKEYENIVLFLTSLVRRMLRKMKSQPLLFVEVLFWKTRKECHYINCESLLHEVGNLKRESAKWGSVSNDGEMGSTQGKGWVRRSIADAFGDDEADFVISHEMDKQKEEDPHEVLQRSKRSNGERKENITSISNDRIQRKENSDSEGHFEHVSQGVSNRRKSLVINEDLERQIKGLYEKYKNSRHCSRLIAEALDQDGKVSPVQVSNKLRQLGLRVLPKKRMLQAGASIQPREEGASGNELKESSVLKPLHTRKRVRAFSEDQETMIKDLFEQFKDQRRCSHMIANALDADGTFTAAQVSRKLKQLGLRVAQQKRPKAETHLKDEDVINFSAETAEHSDNETLLSLKKRSKNKKIERENKDMENQKIEGKVSHDSSEDEFPGSVSGDGHERPSGMEVDDDGTLNRAVNAEAQATSISSEKQVGTIDANNLQHQQLHDELEDQLSDLGDDATPVTSQHGAVLRRKLRMVIDPEDDE
ncbi:hypothetical protein TEA_016690 [Camellia sinensis var. sinensis]|uniref:Timeless N-terminal domain-containing protein n=1 Tax=Camellia sinensis var. sinensis TaxID=542762 RepID=A0A4V3WLP7_CAMSN|nr:hypothetical protein TEA_016690 [Camellia sinensis var. sinensis]